ncbi:MAG: NADH-quinone oxidoreductase subunit M [Sulfurovum sp.]|nr:NADH-quinone oxidoreductase subunit M [Sulfurovum sp.]
MDNILSVLVFFPAIAGLLGFVVDKKSARAYGITVAAIEFLLSLWLWFSFDTANAGMQFVEMIPLIPDFGVNYYLGVDGISLFIIIMATLMTLIGMISMSIETDVKNMIITLLFLEMTMVGVFVALDAIIFYLFWELSLVPMLYIVGAWGGPLRVYAAIKFFLYTFMGSLIMLVGMLFVAYSALAGETSVSLQFDTLLLVASHLSKPWLHAGFVFLLVGFGTKMGLAPLHSWKPDAYGEAPGLVGALLAGGLTSVAFLAILRGVQLMTAAGDGAMARQALLGMGLLSMLMASIFMIRQSDIKRMLAYSSVEHMGLLAIGVGIGGIATFRAMLHLINNALTKGALFLAAGNIQRAFSSKRLSKVRGALNALPISGTLFLAGFLAITGSPPFGPFISEFTILRGTFGQGHMAIGLLMLVFLATVFIGMGSTVLAATQGEPGEKGIEFRDRFLLYISPLVFLLVILMIGVYIPAPLKNALQQAAALLEVQP